MDNRFRLGVGVVAVAVAGVIALANENETKNRDPDSQSCRDDLAAWRRYVDVKATPNDTRPSTMLWSAEMCGYRPSSDERAMAAEAG